MPLKCPPGPAACYAHGVRGLYAIVDPAHCGRHGPLALSQAILAGGCCALQLRSKLVTDAEYIALARPILTACRDAGVPFVVNDRVHAARQLGAAGLHLGQSDMPLSQARGIVGDLSIGLSTHDPSQARAAIAAGADLIGFGPVFDTATKDNPDATVGATCVARVSAEIQRPVVAIGGINLDRARELRRLGVQLAAVISALANAADPREEASMIHACLLGD